MVFFTSHKTNRSSGILLLQWWLCYYELEATAGERQHTMMTEE
jgi:hypothetical protein